MASKKLRLRKGKKIKETHWCVGGIGKSKKKQAQGRSVSVSFFAVFYYASAASNRMEWRPSE